MVCFDALFWLSLLTALSVQALNLPCATKRKTFMTVIQWRAAFDRYALAAHATGQLPLHLALAHVDNVMRICDEGKAKGRPLFPGVIYDQLARRKWADNVLRFLVHRHVVRVSCLHTLCLQTANNAPDFCLQTACTRVDREVVNAAEVSRLSGRCVST